MGTELRGQQEALPQGRHAVVGSAGGLPGPPSQQRPEETPPTASLLRAEQYLSVYVTVRCAVQTLPF